LIRFGDPGSTRPAATSARTGKEGLDKIREAVEEVRGGIDQTKKADEELENALRQGMTQMSNDIGAAMGGKG
jgi:hypothetical protein